MCLSTDYGCNKYLQLEAGSASQLPDLRPHPGRCTITCEIEVLETDVSASLLPSVPPRRKSKGMRRRRSVMAVTRSLVWLPQDQDSVVHSGTCNYQRLDFYYTSCDSCCFTGNSIFWKHMGMKKSWSCMKCKVSTEIKAPCKYNFST